MNKTAETQFDDDTDIAYDYAMDSPLILPKGYLSWSQMSCWLHSKDRYAREYFDDGEKLDTRYLRFGSRFSKMVEELCKIMERIPDRAAAIVELSKEYPMDENMQSVLMELDIEGTSEYEINCKVRGEVTIKAFLDKYRTRDGSIGEYKTGLSPWSLARVQKHDQLLMYGVALKWCGRPLPPYADLHWIETKEIETERVDFWRNGEKIILATGKIKSFHREFDEREFERMEDSIIRVAREISDAYQEHLRQI
jgi:hypothetical protein